MGQFAYIPQLEEAVLREVNDHALMGRLEVDRVDKIWELKDGKITEYWGGYSDYLRQKEEERQQQAAQYAQFIAERNRLERSIEEKRKQALKVDQKAKGAAKKNSSESGGRLPICTFANCLDEDQLEEAMCTFLTESGDRAAGPMVQTKLFRTVAADMLGVKLSICALMAGE
ncbi:hypothetical protein [Sporomusa sphaeroides]|uniref:hypothetical protein n=1 Tax=Sporomusa sphaeroides TaxID=47679 RepID=UPI003D7C2033